MSRGPSKRGRCAHEPVAKIDYARGASLDMLSKGAVQFNLIIGEWYCAKCKRYLKARWYPVEQK